MATDEEHYHDRRKTLAHTFFRSKLPTIIDTIKKVTLDYLKETENETEIEFALFTMQLQARILINILLGPGISDLLISYEDENGTISEITLTMFIKTLIEDSTKRDLQFLYFLDTRLKWFAVTALDR